jgi:uncharacterized membrane protein
MSVRLEFLLFVLALGCASLACRLSGFWMMRFVNITPRIEAALKATPLAVMVGLVVPAAVRGGLAEITALVVTAVAMKITKSDLISAVIGVAVVAIGRSLKLPG